MRLHVWTDLAPPRQAKAILTATMHDVGIRCVDMHWLVALPTALYLRRSLVSFVRGTYVLRLCCRFHRQESGLHRCDLKKSKSPVIFTCLSKESALPGVFVDFSVAWGELPPPRYGCWRLLAHELHRRTESNFRFVPVAQTQCPSTSRKPSLKSPCRLQSCPAQELSST